MMENNVEIKIYYNERDIKASSLATVNLGKQTVMSY